MASLGVSFTRMAQPHHYLSPALPRIIAHRGFAASAGLVENTVAAFESALALGATHIESDIQVTKDGVAVLFHDDDLLRVAGLPQKVSDVLASELAAIDLGGGHRVPTLEQVLRAFPYARFNLDFKVWEALSPATEVISRLNAQDRVLIASFSDRRRAKAQAALTGAVGSAGIARVIGIRLAAALRARRILARLARPVVALQVPVSSGLIRFDNAGFIRELKAVGLEIHFWTVNDSAEMQRLVDLGADGIVTDRTDFAVNTLRTAR